MKLTVFVILGWRARVYYSVLMQLAWECLMSTTTVTDAISQRAAVREYCPQAVDEELVREILEWAGRSSSGGNTQPWKVYALAGEAKERLSHWTLCRK